MLISIDSDLYDINARLKSIDGGYLLYFNKANGCFEVHNSRQKGNTFCLRIPFSELDQRTVDLVLKTRRENADKLFSEMEKHNNALEKEQQGIEF